ncbi:MAG TPA: hypothetical protein VJ001_05480 [Rhodocyclaceae bacterium]|nr:hypothetical protein [Rhodocyclaceae bacterium]
MSIDIKHLNLVLEAATEIEALLNRLPPMANDSALQRIRSLCIQMRGVDSYISEKSGAIEARAARYLSARKHTSHPSGAFALRDEITHDLLNRIRQQVDTLKRQR